MPIKVKCPQLNCFLFYITSLVAVACKTTTPDEGGAQEDRSVITVTACCTQNPDMYIANCKQKCH